MLYYTVSMVTSAPSMVVICSNRLLPCCQGSGMRGAARGGSGLWALGEGSGGAADPQSQEAESQSPTAGYEEDQGGSERV